MNLPISNRLLACCNFVCKGDRVADIGCDHGYLGIHLLTNCIASHMIESDVAPGPLESARRNAKKFGVDTGNYIYAKIEPKSRKTDPFMAFVAAMVCETALGAGSAPVAPPMMAVAM